MRVPESPSLRGVLEAVSAAVAERPEGGHSMLSEVERAVEFLALEAMLALAVNTSASSQARAIARSHIEDLLKQWTTAEPLKDTAEAIHRAAMIERIQEFEKDPAKFVVSKPVEAPPARRRTVETSTPASESRAAAASPKLSAPMQELKPTRQPRTAMLCATMAEELPRVSIILEASSSRSGGSASGRP